ncbi:MAG: rod shape-determining protein MreC [Syntrophales bacterium]|nr:rod shape-determining protein MreC [Syntrophales bacterium]
MVFSRKHLSFLVIIFCLAVSATFLSASLRDPHPSFLRQLIVEFSAPVGRIIRFPVDYLKKLWERYIFLVGREEESRNLKKKNTELLFQIQMYKEGYYESLRLRHLLALKQRIKHRSIASQVIFNYRGSPVRSILIDRGSSDGVKRGFPVMNHDGVVGRVVETSWHTSRVLLITDSSSKIDALIASSRIQGILQGSGGDVCYLKYVSRADKVNPGDEIITAGMSEFFPKGLLLGKVTRVEDRGGMFHYIEVMPAARFSNIEEVLVLIPEREGE